MNLAEAKVSLFASLEAKRLEAHQSLSEQLGNKLMYSEHHALAHECLQSYFRQAMEVLEEGFSALEHELNQENCHHG